MSWESIQAFATPVVFVIGFAIYLFNSVRNKTDATNSQTISILKENISALQTENQILKQENISLKTKLAALDAETKNNAMQIQNLKDLATNTTAINEVKSILNEFKAMMPAQQVMISEFQSNDRIILSTQKEILEAIFRLNKKKTE